MLGRVLLFVLSQSNTKETFQNKLLHLIKLCFGTIPTRTQNLLCGAKSLAGKGLKKQASKEFTEQAGGSPPPWPADAAGTPGRPAAAWWRTPGDPAQPES